MSAKKYNSYILMKNLEETLLMREKWMSKVGERPEYILICPQAKLP